MGGQLFLALLDDAYAGERSFHPTPRLCRCVRIRPKLCDISPASEELPDGTSFARAWVIPTSLQPKLTTKDPTASRGISISRLEIQAHYFLARTVSRLRETMEIDISELLLWTDSTTSIQWHKKDHHGGVTKSSEGLEAISVRYINTSVNPADLASRGC